MYNKAQMTEPSYENSGGGGYGGEMMDGNKGNDIMLWKFRFGNDF